MNLNEIVEPSDSIAGTSVKYRLLPNRCDTI